MFCSIASTENSVVVEHDASSAFVAPVAPADNGNVESTVSLYNTSKATKISFATGVKDGSPDETMEISTREVDYDVSPPNLYLLMEKRQWDESLKLLSKLTIEEAFHQTSTWVVRKEANSGKVRWRLLPLHAAIIFKAPLMVVDALLKTYPGACRCKDDQGMLPIHLAFRNDASDEIITKVLAAFPSVLKVTDRKGRDPLSCAMGGSCTLKPRAVLLATYSSIAVAAERDSILKEERESEAMSRSELQQRAERADSLEKEIKERDARETLLAEKVEDLSKALEAMSKMRQAESKTYNEDVQASKQLHDQLQRLSEQLQSAEETVSILSSEKNTVKSSMDQIVGSHRRLQAERDGLVELNEYLENLLERTGIITKLNSDMLADQTVRKQMLDALVKQEGDDYATAAKKHAAMNGVLERQQSETEAAFEVGYNQSVKSSHYNLSKGIGRRDRIVSQVHGRNDSPMRMRSSSPTIRELNNVYSGDLSALGMGDAMSR